MLLKRIRTKVFHKNVSKVCKKMRRKNCIFIMLLFIEFFYIKNLVINEYAKNDLVKRALFDLP